VRLVLKDVKKQSGQAFEPVVSSLTNYFPFGMEKYDRSAESGGSRFGYIAMLIYFYSYSDNFANFDNRDTHRILDKYYDI
jgi:hypothetical protein